MIGVAKKAKDFFLTGEINMKKMIAAFAATALLAFSAVAFVGCGGESDEDLIRGALTEELETIKTLDDATIAEMTSTMNASTFATYGIDPSEFMKTYLEGFDYSIDEVIVDGDTAKATVTLTCKSFSAYESILEANTNKAIETQDISSMNEAQINELVGNIMMDSLKEVQPVACKPFTIEYTNADGEWTPTAASEQAISTALLTN